MEEADNKENIGQEPKNHRLFTIAAIVLIGFSVSVAFHYVYGHYWNAGYPFNTFLFIPSDRFKDFFNVYNNICSRSLYSTTLITNYFPFTYVIVYCLTVFPSKLALLTMLVAFMGSLGYMVRRYFVDAVKDRALKTMLFFIITFLSYPVIFAIDRANIELILFVFLALFFYLYYVRKNETSIIFLAMAISMKLYPAVLLILLISDKKYRAAILTALLSLLITILSYFWASLQIGKGLLETLSLSLKHLALVSNIYAFVQLVGIQHGHSFWGIVSLTKILGSVSNLNRFILPYVALVAVFFLVISSYVIFVEKAPWKKVALLILPMILFPFFSSDYTLINVLFPVAFFINSTRSRYDVLYPILFGFLLIPLDYYWLQNDISISVILYPVLIMTLIVVILIEGLQPLIFRNNDKKSLAADVPVA